MPRLGYRTGRSCILLKKTPGGKFYLEARREIFDERFIKELEDVVNLKIRPTHDFITSTSPDGVNTES